MIKNSLMKFIDSCVGNIARKIEDEFNESDHPRDKGGKFTSKGGEGRGGGKQEKSSSRKAPGDNVVTTSMEFTGDEEDAKQLAEKYGFDYKLTYPKGSPYATIKMTGDKNALREYAVNEGFGSEDVAREFVPELFEESEESEEGDDDEGVSLNQYKENVRENFDGDEEYEVEARYDRAKFHSDQFKKLKNGEFTTNPDKERWLKNYYRRVGMKKPEDAFKVWWDI